MGDALQRPDNDFKLVASICEPIELRGGSRKAAQYCSQMMHTESVLLRISSSRVGSAGSFSSR
jgi:hypothetical protein